MVKAKLIMHACMYYHALELLLLFETFRYCINDVIDHALSCITSIIIHVISHHIPGHQNSGVANQIIRSKAAVRYIQSQPNGIAKTAEIIKDVPAALFSSDTFTRTLFNLVINEN